MVFRDVKSAPLGDKISIFRRAPTLKFSVSMISFSVAFYSLGTSESAGGVFEGAHMAHERRPRYFLQFFPRIRTAQAAVSDEYPGRITFGSSYLSFREGGGEKAEKRDLLCQWAEPELNVQSHLDPRLIPGEALHVRFRTRPQGRVVKGGETCELGDLSSVLNDSKIPKSGSLVIRCGFCYNTLIKDSQ